MAVPTPQRLATVSDLHFFNRRSEAEHYVDVIREAALEADVFVLNGDIFDFRWSTLASPEQTVHAAMALLTQWVAAAPGCSFHYVLGNHDHYRLFIDALDAFAAERPNFAWCPFYLRLGTSLFLHGDVANWKMSASDLERYREGWLEDRNRGPAWNAVHDAVFSVGLHKAVHRVAFPRRAVLARLHHYVESIGHGPDCGIDTVYFGHTHLAIAGDTYNGLTYRNCGAAMPGLAFKVLKAELTI